MKESDSMFNPMWPHVITRVWTFEARPSYLETKDILVSHQRARTRDFVEGHFHIS